MITRQSLTDALDRYRIAEHLRVGLIEWVINAQPPGGFLRAVIENDLFGAFDRADDRSANCLRGILRWFYNQAPGGSHGGNALTDWRGMEGVE